MFFKKVESPTITQHVNKVGRKKKKKYTTTTVNKANKYKYTTFKNLPNNNSPYINTPSLNNITNEYVNNISTPSYMQIGNKSYGYSRYLKYPIGVFARSSRVTPSRHSIAPEIEQIMNEYNIPPKPTYPTKECCEKYNDLKFLVQNLSALKKHSERLSMDYKALLEKSHTRNDSSV